MKITILNGGHRSIELPLSDEELNFQMRQMGIRETIPKGKLVKVSEKDNLILSILVDTFISKISFPMQPGPEIGSISDA